MSPVLLLVACSASSPTPSPGEPEPEPVSGAPYRGEPEQRRRREGQPPNFLVLVADDVGTDKIGAYREAPVTPVTPHIDQLAASGVLFRNAYAYPVCSATRAALLTGRYGRRNGLGYVVGAEQSTWELPLKEVTLAEALDRGGQALGRDWTAIAIGKWHLATPRSPSGFRHPLLQGFDHHKGVFGNLNNVSRDHGAGRRGNYFAHERVDDGEASWSTTYATTETVDDAIASLKGLSEPWLLWVGFNAAHEPFDPPPPALSRARVTRDDPPFRREHAIIEAMDKELGRLLAALGPLRERTTIVFLGDNGTERDAVLPPFEPSHGKNSLFEGGINIPLVVAGHGVGKGESHALVHAVDLLPTLLDLAGQPVPEGLVLDGMSFAPVLADPSAAGPRKFVYTEKFAPVGPGPYETDQVAIRDDRYKLIQTRSGKVQFFDLKDRHDDGKARAPRDLQGEARARFQQLQQELARIQREARFEY